MIIAGIDPGVSPAVGILDRRTATAFRIPQEGHLFQESVLRDVLVDAGVTHAIVELVGPMPGQGLASTAHFMAAWGLIRGTLVGLGIPYKLVTPQMWKQAILEASEVEDPGERKDAQKAAAVAFVRKTYPGVRLIRKGCRVPDHNLAEALCLAHWGKHHGSA